MLNIKKNALLVAFLFSTGFFCSAQTSSSKGDLLINPSITIGWYDYSYGLNRVSVIPPVGLNFEYNFADYFGAGLEGTYSSRKYQDFDFTDLSSSYEYRYQSVSVRGSLHYLDILKLIFDEELSNEKLEALDLYVMASSGVQWVNSYSGVHLNSNGRLEMNNTSITNSNSWGMYVNASCTVICGGATQTDAAGVLSYNTIMSNGAGPDANCSSGGCTVFFD